MKKITIVVTAFALLAAGCNTTPAPQPQTNTQQPATPQSGNTVTIQNFAFSPSAITVKKGETVVWTNKDSVAHTITGDGGLNSPTLSTNQTYSFTFNSVGTFKYHCSIHPTMLGTVTVTP